MPGASAAASADRPVLLYVESDGMVLLVERSGKLTFPREGEVAHELDFRGEMDFPEAKVLFAVPHLDAWPRDWTFKDDVPAMTNVETIVHRAINASLVREVVGALCYHPDGDRILLVKASRGFTKGMWNIPGGFVTYAEAPEEGMVREMAEETGLDIRIERLLGVFTQKFGSPYYMRGHMFLARALSTTLELQKDEIAEAGWFTLAEARKLVLNPFGRKAMDALERGPGPAPAPAPGLGSVGERAVLDEFRHVVETVGKTDKYAKVISESLLASLNRIEEKHAKRE